MDGAELGPLDVFDALGLAAEDGGDDGDYGGVMDDFANGLAGLGLDMQIEAEVRDVMGAPPPGDIDGDDGPDLGDTGDVPVPLQPAPPANGVPAPDTPVVPLELPPPPLPPPAPVAVPPAMPLPLAGHLAGRARGRGRGWAGRRGGPEYLSAWVPLREDSDAEAVGKIIVNLHPSSMSLDAHCHRCGCKINRKFEKTAARGDQQRLSLPPRCIRRAGQWAAISCGCRSLARALSAFIGTRTPIMTYLTRIVPRYVTGRRA